MNALVYVYTSVEVVTISRAYIQLKYLNQSQLAATAAQTTATIE